MHLPPNQLIRHFHLWIVIGVAGLLAGCQTSRAVEPAGPAPAPTTQVIEATPVVAAADPEPTPAPAPEAAATASKQAADEQDTQLLLQQAFSKQMDAIRDGMNRLGSREFNVEPYMDKLVSAGPHGRDTAFPALMTMLGNRLELEATLVDRVEAASRLYKQFTLATEAERQRLLATNKLMDSELGVVGDELKKQVKRLAGALQTQDELSIFTAFTDQKTEYVERLHDQLAKPVEMPSLDQYFTRWSELLKTRVLTDQYHILNLAYYAEAYGWKDRLGEVMNEVSSMAPADYLKGLGKEGIAGSNLVTVLDAGFSEMVKAAVDPSSTPKVTAGQGFHVSIEPDRGLGGVYYYSDSPDGLKNPTRVDREDGSYYYAERISFTIKSTRNAWFIMRHINARGQAQQLCPNQYAPKVNLLKANQPLVIPGEVMPFEFAASEPPGIEAVRLIVTPRRIDYDPKVDKVEMATAQVFADELAMTGQPTTRGLTRGLKLQKRVDTNSASSHDQAWFNDSADGNAVMVETFIRVMPLRH